MLRLQGTGSGGAYQQFYSNGAYWGLIGDEDGDGSDLYFDIKSRSGAAGIAMSTGTTNNAIKIENNGQVNIKNLPTGANSDSFVTADASGNLRAVSAISSTPSYQIGDFAQGGVVFWLSPDGRHGKVISIFDATYGAWSNVSAIIAAVPLSLNNGAGNTIRIITQSGHTYSAALVCSSSAYGGYNDWYLPSTAELTEVFSNKVDIDDTISANNGDALSPTYWSSTEQLLSFNAIVISMSNGSFSGSPKTDLNYSRAIRAFSLE